MIEIKDLTYKYKNGTIALNNINLNIQKGEFVAVLGRNGSGKSTFSRLISGINKPSSGTILVNGFDTASKKTFLDLRKEISIVFQNPEHQIVFERVYDDIAFALKNLNYSNAEIEKRISSALEKVDMLEYKNSSTFELSLGQKQRITIASSLALNPNILVLDEPTSMLDPISRKQIYSIVKKLHNEGTTIIYITHVLDEIFLADRIILFENGSLKKDISKQEIVNNIAILKKFNIELPTLISIILKLQESGINLDLNDFSEDSFIKAIQTHLN